MTAPSSQPGAQARPAAGGLVGAVATVGGLTLISRILGFGRDVLIAAVAGAGAVTDAFFIAFAFPNLFRRLFGEGAFSTAFVPMFARILADEGRLAARAFAEQALAFLVLGLSVLVVAMMLAMPWVVGFIAPGFRDDPAVFALAERFTTITTPYLLFVCVVAMLGGVLNALERYAAMAAAPILLNLILIAALGLFAAGWLDALWPTAGDALAWGVAATGVAQLAWMLWHCRRAGIVPRLPLPRATPDMRRLWILLLPALGAHGVMQINILIGNMLASTLPTGSVSYLYLADRVNQLPLGIVGVAIATAMLPRLTRALRGEDPEPARVEQSRALEIALLLTLPAAVALAVIAEPIVAGLFQRAAFDAQAASATAAALTAYALGLPAFVLVKVLATAFFAREDTRTPFRAAAAAVASYVVMALILKDVFGHVGLAAATSLSGWINAGILAAILWRSGRLHLDDRVRTRLPRIALSCAVMGLALWPAAMGLSEIAPPGEAGRALTLAGLVALGLAVYGGCVVGLRAARPAELRAALRRRGEG